MSKPKLSWVQRNILGTDRIGDWIRCPRDGWVEDKLIHGFPPEERKECPICGYKVMI
jgi:hypothetical protein